MCLILHCADISNPTKPYHIHCQWTEMLLEEFFRQGDDEIKIGLPASPMMDRNTTLIPDSQIGFMNVIVKPTFTVLHDMFDLITTQILLEFKKNGSRRASACVLPASNSISNENNNHKLGKQKITDITNGENNNNIINSISKDKMINLEDKSKTNNNSENTENSNNSESRDDLTKLQDRKTSNKTENSSNSNKPKLRSTPSWVESQKNKDSLGLHYNSNTERW